MDNAVEKVYDIIIIGSGPAGLTAAIYAGRAELNTLIIEKEFAGGQIVRTHEIDNYPGLPGVSGIDLAIKLQKHAVKFNYNILSEDVVDLQLDNKIKIVKTTNNVYKTKTVIIATGAKWREIGVDGEERLKGKGVSYCATCDGAFFKDKVTAVIGGGDTAVEDAIYLSRFCKKVYLVHRRDQLRAVKVLQQKLFQINNVEVLWNSEIDKILGEQFVSALKIKNNKTEEVKNIDVDGVFIAVGISPNSMLIKGKVKLNQNGYVLTNEDCETSVHGVYAVGDIRKKSLRQIITAAADGAISVFAAERYILENFGD